MSIEKFFSVDEKSGSGHPAPVYAVYGAKNKNAAIEAVARMRKENINMVREKAKVRVAFVDGDDLWWGDDATDAVLKRGRRCWAVML